MTEEKSEYVKKLEELGFKRLESKPTKASSIPRKKRGVRAEDAQEVFMQAIAGLAYPWFMTIMGRTVAVTEHDGKWSKDEIVDLSPHGFNKANQ